MRDLTFTGPLSEMLTRAFLSARDRTSPTSVYDELRKLAKLPDPKEKFPLHDVIDGRVRYWKNTKLAFYDRRNVADRYRQLKSKVATGADLVGEVRKTHLEA